MTAAAAAAVRHGARGEGALAAFAVGALGATMLLETAWLTVALAALVAAAAVVWRAVPLWPLRALGAALALVVVVRVVGDTATGAALREGGTLPWLGYALGLPAAALAIAAGRLRRGPDDALALLLEGGAAVIGMLLLVALAARAGDVAAEARTTLAAAVLILALLAAALVLQRLAGRGRASAGLWAEVALGLALGILMRRAELRWTLLAVLIMGVAKVFLLDLAGLEGLGRVASFLGLVLVAIGLAYQRFVLAREPA